MDNHSNDVRVTCNLVNTRNDLGRDKLFATITPQGVSAYCKYCRVAHIVALEQCLAVWGIEDSRRKLLLDGPQNAVIDIDVLH